MIKHPNEVYWLSWAVVFGSWHRLLWLLICAVCNMILLPLNLLTFLQYCEIVRLWGRTAGGTVK